MDPRERFADCTDNELMRCMAAGQKTAYEVLILRHRKAAEESGKINILKTKY